MAMSVVHYPFHNERRRFLQLRLGLGAQLSLAPPQGIGKLPALQRGLFLCPAAELLQFAFRLVLTERKMSGLKTYEKMPK